jgi:hypothetical protein
MAASLDQNKLKGKPYSSEEEKFLLSLVKKRVNVIENKKTDAQNNEYVLMNSCIKVCQEPSQEGQFVMFCLFNQCQSESMEGNSW